MAWDTADHIINDAAVEMGLLSADVADPYASTDVNVLQLCRLLKGLGQDLARDYQWSHLQAEHTFSTADGTASYDLPDGYLRLIDQTQYNRTDQERLTGPLSAQGWQYLKATTGTEDVWFRVKGTELLLYPTPTSVESMALEYVSRFWVQSLDAVAPDKEAPTEGEDILWFDRRLLVCGLKLAFQRAKGFDASAAKADFDEALARARGGDGAAPVLSLNGGSGPRLLDASNLPARGFGS